VSVLDGCGGIPATEIGRVFEMGYRGDKARSPGEGRGGLGLAVAQGLVLAHAGQIEVANEPDGCRFTVSIPMRNT
jgi:signal transduction histidine kinase